MPPPSGVPANRYQHSLSRCITCHSMSALSSHMRQNACYRSVKGTQKICCLPSYTIKTNSRTIRSQVGNLTLQAKERT